jgi:quinol monooxygenase YgiN
MREPQATQHLDEVREAAVYVVSYFEVMSSAAGEAAALLRQYGEASRTAAGRVRLEALRQRDRPDHFATVGVWTDQQAFEAQATAAHTRQWHERLRPLLVSPFDERLHTGLVIDATQGIGATGAVYVVTHADAIPPAKDDAMAALRQLAETSRHDHGNTRFEVFQQRNRQNHFTVVEVWQDQNSLESHVMAAHTRRFRDAFQPMTGSLYDERLYQALG